jgi:hypothetical protein
MSNLPPMPEPAGWAPVLGNQNIFTADQLRAYGDARAAHEREACAKVVEWTPSQWGEHSRFAAAIRARSQEG